MMRLWIHMTTLIILILCASSYGLPTGNPSNGNDLKSSESASDLREISLEDSATNSKTPVDEFLDFVPDLYKSHFVREQGGKKVAFQPGITKCIKALKWLQEAYFHNISTVSTFIKYNMDSCSNERESKTFCAKNGHGRIRSFKNRCRQCAKGCKDVLNGGTRFTSVNQDFCREADKACKACENNSTCVYKESGYKCNCLAGFQGINCTEDINECANVSCQNGATCIDKVNAYECNCVTGFRGTLCEEDINECANVSCQNGATCIDKVNGYECNCVTGFRGTLCEEDINECAYVTCHNGATCIDKVNGYECKCVRGFRGTLCEEEKGMMSSYPGFKTIFHDPDYYAESLRAFARLSSKYQVLATWTDTVFPKIVVKRLAVDLTDTKGKLKVLGVGSGTGEMDCKMLQQLLVRYPNISSTVIEPALKLITEFKALASGEGYTGIEWDWRQQTWEEYYQDLQKPGREVDKMHFISAIHSLYHVTDGLETNILNMFHHLKEGGILMIVLLSERTGSCRLINHFPMFADNLHSHCNSKHVREILKKHKIDFEVITQESQLDITCCFEEGSVDGPLIVDFVAQTLRLKETAPSKLVDEVLEYMSGSDCSVRRGEKILLSNDWDAIIVKKGKECGAC